MTANDKSKTYGDVNPALDGDGDRHGQRRRAELHAGDDGAAVLDVGSYPITVTLGSNPNYTVTPTDGTLTVNQRPATVTANDKSKTYGDVNPALDGDGDRHGQRRRAQLHAGDDGDEVLATWRATRSR